MSLTPDQIRLMRVSLDQVRQAMEPGDTFFYDRLFHRRPDYRALFRDDIAGQGMKFLSTLETVLDALSAEGPDAAIAEQELAQLAQGHAAMGITAAHYAPLGEALRETLAAMLGEAYTEEVAAAWRAGYAHIAARMIDDSM